jgi:hypothetical protein
MNGKTSKRLRKYASFRFMSLDALHQAKLRGNVRNLYKIIKEQYYLHGRSFSKMVAFVSK